MKKQLEKLDAYLKEKRPEYYNQLLKPLSEKEILDLQEEFNIELPNDIKELYLWKNGQRQDCYKSFVNNSIFEPLEAVLATNKELTELIGYDFEIENWWNENWIPIFSNGGGDYICYDLKGMFTGQKGQLLEYWNDDEERIVIAPNLISFIEKINTYYETTSIEEFDEDFDISDSIEKWEKKFIVNKLIEE